MVFRDLMMPSTTCSSTSTSSVGTRFEQILMSDKARQVLHLLRHKGPPLTHKQLDYCSEACIGRYLRRNGNHVKKAAKQMRATLLWRAALDVDFLTADEFSAELASGLAYVAGRDEDGRVVVVIRIRPENTQSNIALKKFLRFFVFTMEVAIAIVGSTCEQQCVLIVDAGHFHNTSSSTLSSMLQKVFRILNDHYPQWLAKAFVMDAPSMFHYLWKGLGAFINMGIKKDLIFVSSKTYAIASTMPTLSHIVPKSRKSFSHDDKMWRRIQFEDFDSSNNSNNKDMSCDRNDIKTRSLSFANHWKQSSKKVSRSVDFASSRVDAPNLLYFLRKEEEKEGSKRWAHYAHNLELEREDNHDKLQYQQKVIIDVFQPYFQKFMTLPYNEASYRAQMKPPRSGLISIISCELNYNRDVVKFPKERPLDSIFLGLDYH